MLNMSTPMAPVEPGQDNVTVSFESASPEAFVTLLIADSSLTKGVSRPNEEAILREIQSRIVRPFEVTQDDFQPGFIDMLNWHQLTCMTDLLFPGGRSLNSNETTTPAPATCSLDCNSTLTIPSGNIGVNISFDLSTADVCVVDSICAPWSSVVSYSWTAPRTCAARVSTTSFQFADTVLAVSDSTTCNSIVCDDDTNVNLLSQVTFRAQENVTYVISVGEYYRDAALLGRGGAGTFLIECLNVVATSDKLIMDQFRAECNPGPIFFDPRENDIVLDADGVQIAPPLATFELLTAPSAEVSFSNFFWQYLPVEGLPRIRFEELKYQTCNSLGDCSNGTIRLELRELVCNAVSPEVSGPPLPALSGDPETTQRPSLDFSGLLQSVPRVRKNFPTKWVFSNTLTNFSDGGAADVD